MSENTSVVKTEVISKNDVDTQLRALDCGELGRIRTVIIDGAVWFVVKDVCDCIGYSNSRVAVAKYVDDDDKDVTKCYTLGGNQDMTIINEAGLYSIIFGCNYDLIQHRTSETKINADKIKQFKHDITHKLLPNLRQNLVEENEKLQKQLLELDGEIRYLNHVMDEYNKKLTYYDHRISLFDDACDHIVVSDWGILKDKVTEVEKKVDALEERIDFNERDYKFDEDDPMLSTDGFRKFGYDTDKWIECMRVRFPNWDWETHFEYYCIEDWIYDSMFDEDEWEYYMAKLKTHSERRCIEEDLDVKRKFMELINERVFGNYKDTAKNRYYFMFGGKKHYL